MNLLKEEFKYPNGLLTNEYAHWNPTDPASVKSQIWDMDSGSIFSLDGKGHTGKPDTVSPNAKSTNGTNSAIFRLTTKRADFENIQVSFGLINKGLTSTLKTPAVNWDGIHIFLRYKSEYSLYYASINRRDNTVVIKKKTPGGQSNGGSYSDLTPYIPFKVPLNAPQTPSAVVKTNADGSVTIQLFEGGKLLAEAKDDGKVGGPPILGPGRVGIRSDNAEFLVSNFTVDSYTPASGSFEIPAGAIVTVSYRMA